MSEVLKQDGVISNCIAMETNSDKIPNENCHKDGMTDHGLVKDVGKTEPSIKDLDLDEGELGGLLALCLILIINYCQVILLDIKRGVLPRNEYLVVKAGYISIYHIREFNRETFFTTLTPTSSESRHYRWCVMSVVLI